MGDLTSAVQAAQQSIGAIEARVAALERDKGVSDGLLQRLQQMITMIIVLRTSAAAAGSPAARGGVFSHSAVTGE